MPKLISGKLINQNSGIELNYFCHDIDETGDPSYYGFMCHTGNWYIVEYSESAGTLRYIMGIKEYSTNWTGRAGLSYDYLNNAYKS